MEDKEITRDELLKRIEELESDLKFINERFDKFTKDYKKVWRNS